jgi:acyl dehydratase
MMHANTNTRDVWSATIGGKPAVGTAAERSRRTSMRDVEMFTAMTGDRNPLHYDPLLASQTPFGSLIVQGGVTSGLLNAVVAEDLPGPGTVFLGVEWRFLKAVHVGEEITARVEVVAVRDDKPICTMATAIRNARGEVCLSGSAVTYTVPLIAGVAGGATAKPNALIPARKASELLGPPRQGNKVKQS